MPINTKVITAAFSKGMAPATLNTASFTLACNGIPVTTRGYGETKPIASNKTKAGRTENRCIVAHFTCD